MCSWNVNGKVQNTELTDWIKSDSPPDLVVIGFQEMVDLNAQNLLMTDITRAQEWDKMFAKALTSRSTSYQLVSYRTHTPVRTHTLMPVPLPSLRHRLRNC